MSNQFLLFACGPYKLLISCNMVQSIVDIQSSADLEGLKKKNVQLCSLAKKLACTSQSEQLAIILHINQRRTALLVDRVSTVIRIEEQAWQELPLRSSAINKLFDRIYYFDQHYAYHISHSYLETLCL